MLELTGRLACSLSVSEKTRERVLASRPIYLEVCSLNNEKTCTTLRRQKK